jgi:5-hydroxyisourate hydrolase
MGRLTTHVLDTANGCPGEGIHITLKRLTDAGERVVIRAVTNADGRVDSPILDGDAFRAGTYVLEFAVGDYFRARGVALADPAFLDVVPLRFGVSDADAHYHVPLLVSPYGFSTYRGS